MCNIPLLSRHCRESYNDPEEVYELLKRRGMDLVTVTDHDSIDAAEALRHHRDFFLSEEVTCVTPSGTEIHAGVYGIAEHDHVELQRRRTDVPALAAYLREQKLFFSINHVFSSLTGRRTDQDFALFEDLFPAIETLNGAIPPRNNAAAARLARQWRKSIVAGSDAHTLAALGQTFTEVPGAANIASFLRGLRYGQAQACGVAGDYWKLTRVVADIALSFIGEKKWAALFSPLMIGIPMVTFGNHLCEVAFEKHWSRRILSGEPFGIPVADALLEITDVGQ